MAVLNKFKFPYIRTQIPGPSSLPPYIDYRNDTFLWTIRNFNDGFDYFYIELFCGNAFDYYEITDIIPASIYDKICNDNKTYLYLCNSHEAFTDVLIYPLYKKLVLEKGMPPHKIIVSNEAADLCNTVIQCANEHNLTYFQTEWVRVFESTMSFQSWKHVLNSTVLDENKNYTKRYLNFNRRWRLHRPLIVALLLAYDLLDKGYVSLGHCDDNKNWHDVFPNLKNYNNNHPIISQLIDSVESKIYDLPNLYLDFTDLTVNLPNIEEESLQFYKNSLISLVNETNFYSGSRYNSSRFLSEKIFKPVAYGHPFILASVPRSLELLRSLGYKTFHPYIDESYDTESDDQERVLKLLNEVKKICNYSEEEVKTFIRNVRPIVEHNQQHLRSKTLHSVNGSDHSSIQKNFIVKTI